MRCATAGARRGFDDTFDRQIIRQGTSRRPRVLCALLFKILDGQLKLLDQQPVALRRLSVLLAPRLGQHQLQPLDFQAADGHFALRRRQLLALRKDHRVRSGKVGGKRIGGRRQTDKSIIFAAKNPAGFPVS
jgi:hypothetical protein